MFNRKNYIMAEESFINLLMHVLINEGSAFHYMIA